MTVTPPIAALPAGWTRHMMDDFDIGLPFALWRARQAAVVRLLAVLRDRRMTEPQWRMLRLLGVFGTPQSQSGLARICGFYVTHVKRTASALIARGAADWFKAKQTDPRPKRWEIGITQYGYRLVGEIQAELRARAWDASGIFSAADGAALRDLLARYTESVLWSPLMGRDEDRALAPLFVFHEKHARRAQLAAQKWRLRDAARRAGRSLSPAEVQRALDDV